MQKRVDDERLTGGGVTGGIDGIPMVVLTLFRDIESLGAIGVIVSASEEFSKDGIVS